MAANRVIGRAGQLPWHLPEDLAFFKKLTLGHPVLMGRKTWESIGRPLPGRRNLVLSRHVPATPPPKTEWVSSFEEVCALPLDGPVYLIGGAEIYRWLLPYCDSVYLTYVHAEPEGDARMPPFEADFPVVDVLAQHDGFEIRHYQRQSRAGN